MTETESANDSSDASASSTDDPVLECVGLTKQFGGLTALHDVDVSLYPAEILGLIGPNGAGKTTLFNCLSGVYEPTRGSVLLKGEDAVGWPPHRYARNGLARTFQITRPIEQLTVIENVMLGAHVHTRRRSEARATAADVLETLSMGDVADRPAGELPIGRQKVMELGRVMATEPDALLVDEMMAGLTPAESARILETLAGIRDRGTALFVIEHDMQAVMDVSDRIVVLDNGEKLTEGPPEDVANDERVIDVYLGESHA